MILSNLEGKREQENPKTKLQSRVTSGVIGSKSELKKRSYRDILVKGKNRNQKERKSVKWRDELCSLNAINSDCNRDKNRD